MKNPTDKSACWIRTLFTAWILWFGFMIALGFAAKSSRFWIAMDAVTRTGQNLILEANVPLPTGTSVRMATTAPGFTPPPPVSVLDSIAQFSISSPESTGIHLWSALPVEGSLNSSLSNGTLAVLEKDAHWVAIDIDEIIAQQPWRKLATTTEPFPYASAHFGMLELARTHLLICSSRIPLRLMPKLRSWWDNQHMPVVVVAPESSLTEMLEDLIPRIGPPRIILMHSDQKDGFQKAMRTSSNSSDLTSATVLTVGKNTPQLWEDCVTYAQKEDSSSPKD